MITSMSNNNIKNVIKCIKSAREREKQNLFVVEGIRMFSEMPENKHIKTYVTEKFYEQNRRLFDKKAGFSFEFVAEHVMQAMSDTKTPQGVISLVNRFRYEAYDVMEGKNGREALIIAVENLQDPGNLGTIIRTAEGAGVTGIVMSRDTVDIYNPKVVRATMGSIFRVPFIVADDLTAWIKGCKNSGFMTYSAHLKGENFYRYDYSKKTVFCIGNEGNGLSDELMAATTDKVFIPMEGEVESLNAATAATVLMYEAMRQRGECFRQN